MADALYDVTRRGDLVFDPFMGSGTTLIAAQATGRAGYGIELDPVYVDVTIMRWEKMTGQQAVHAELGKTFGEVALQRLVGGEAAEPVAAQPIAASGA